MALDSATISNLYRRYLGRDANAGEIEQITTGTGQLGQFSNPQGLESLLSSTSKSIKQQAIDRARGAATNLGSPQPQTPQALYGGKLPDYASFEQGNPQLQQATSEYDVAQKNFGMLQEDQAAQPSRSRSMLKAGSYYFGETYDDLRKKFSDPSSPWFVPDTNTRAGVIDDAMTKRNTTMQDVIQKIGDIYNVVTTAASNELAGQRDKVEGIRKTLDKSYQLLFSYYGEQQAEENARKAEEVQHKNRLSEIYAGKSGSGSGDVGNTLRKLLGDKLGTAAELGYSRQQNEAGGYTFYNPEGKAITVDEFTKATGLGKSDALAGSRDRADIRYAYTPEQQKAIGTLTDNIRMEPDIFDFQVVRDNYNRIRDTASLKTGQGDLSVIFAYMKVLDPTSVVREEEYKNAASAVGKLPQLANTPRNWISGQKLTEAGRQGFIQAAERLYNSKLQSHQRAIDSFRKQADAYGIDPDIVLRDYTAGGSPP